MTLRLRYSLLTLLVLTALVAGGVKWWRGPHWVIESPRSGEEIEYTYTRDWRGDKHVQGVLVKRIDEAVDPPGRRTLEYFRQGANTNWKRVILLDHGTKTFTNAWVLYNYLELELSAAEREEYDRAAQQEYQRLEAQGFTQEQQARSDHYPRRWNERATR